MWQRVSQSSRQTYSTSCFQRWESQFLWATTNMSQAEVYDAEPTSLFGIGRFFSPPFRLITPVFLSTSSFSYYEGLTNPIFLSLCFTTCLWSISFKLGLVSLSQSAFPEIGIQRLSVHLFLAWNFIALRSISPVSIGRSPGRERSIGEMNLLPILWTCDWFVDCTFDIRKEQCHWWSCSSRTSDEGRGCPGF